ncbi:MAG: ABC transporter ATP-binding protein [candidate division Zixibacteria bacterium]|nr:ABC transporter ATP-binding protein [candidate division Zixibacteria bacterium]
MKLYWRLLRYLKPHLPFFIPAFIFMFLFSLSGGISLTTIVPITQLIFESTDDYFDNITDDYKPTLGELRNFDKKAVLTIIGGKTREDKLARVCFLLAFVFLVKNFFWYCQSFLIVRSEQGVIRDIRNDLYRKYHSLPLSYFHGVKSGELISRISNDVLLVRGAVGDGLSKLGKNAFNFLFFLALALLASWRMALASLLILPPAVLLISLLSRRLRVNSAITQQKMASITAVLQETVSGIRVVKAFGMEKFELAKFMKFANHYFRTMVKLTRIGSLSVPLTEILGVTAGALILWYGGKQILAGGGLTTSTFILFLLAVFSMMDPVKKLSQVNIDIQQGLAAARRIFEVIDTPELITEKTNAINHPGLKHSIKYENVYYDYGVGDFALNNINIELKKGEILALVGPSGGGKSTLVDLLPRFYDIKGGKIAIDDIDIRDITIDSLRSMMGIVTQEIILFNDTVANNIAYGQNDTSIARIKEVARAAFADDFIEQLPEGYNTIIGDRGVKLSGGQRQRLSIARALFKDPPILIFDEATSSLDTESELLIQKAIDNLLAGRTVIVVAHRLSTIRNADKILVIDKGKIIERGAHTSLIENNGLYKRLYDMQFSIIE